MRTSFTYDPFGRRTQKTVAGTSTTFLYDGANVAQEVIGGTNTANLLSGGIDEVFKRTDSVGTSNFLADALGSTVALADGSGNLSNQYTYEPFGNASVTGSVFNPYQYTGRENDATGLYFYRARYYSPTLQRFIGEDPLDGLGIANAYAYASDDPVDRIDPTGLSDLIYLGGSGVLIVLDGNGNIAGIYPGGNNVASTARNDDGTPTGPYQPGTYTPGGYNPHSGDGPNSKIGSNGITYFPRPGCPYCGVHSGQENRPDGLQRIGPQHATGGCIRTTDDATRKILDLTNAGDPLKHLYVR